MTEKPMTSSTLSIAQQADFVDGLSLRCVMRGGTVAGETHLTIEKADVEILRALGLRLRRMAPHEDAIRKLVVGR